MTGRKNGSLVSFVYLLSTNILENHPMKIPIMIENFYQQKEELNVVLHCNFSIIL
jgi:hypothetical protein